LKQLKGRPAFLIERDDLAIEDNRLDGQQLERIKHLRIVERLVVASACVRSLLGWRVILRAG
jgi:hypothetical protein